MYITMKRLEPKDIKLSKAKVKKEAKSGKSEAQQTTASVPQTGLQMENKCLIRVHNSKKKISTIVSAKDINKFQLVSIVLYCLVVWYG